MSDLVLFQPVRALDRNGVFSPGALARFYEPGTMTPRTVYTNSVLTVAHPSPLVANASGVFPPVYTSGLVKAIITDADGVTLPGGVMDPAFTLSAGGAGAEGITFAATGNIPQTNVQAAIVAVDGNWRTALATAGVGITSSATLLANFNATGIAAGVYRFDATTTGTRPSEWASGDDGVFEFQRQTEIAGIAFAARRSDGALWRRQLSASTWGAWARVEPAALDQSTWSTGTATGEATITPAKLAAAIDAQAGQILTFSAQTETTSGTSHDITGIPSTAREVEVYLRGVKITDNEHLLVQLIDSVSGAITSGYVATSGNAGAAYTSTAGFPIVSGGASGPEFNGIMRIVRTATGIWVSSHSMARGTVDHASGGGNVTIANALSGIRLNRVGGSNSFNGGFFCISWR